MKRREFYQFYKQSTEKKWRTKLNVIATLKPFSKRTRILSNSNLTTIYRYSLSMRQNYHNDFRKTLVYFTIINSNWVPSIHLANSIENISMWDAKTLEFLRNVHS